MPYTKSRIKADISGPGGLNLGVANDWSGAEKTSNATTYRTDAGAQILGGNPTRNDGKSTYLFNTVLAAIYGQLDGMVGRADQKFRFDFTMTGDDGTAMPGVKIPSLTGILKTLPPPPGDPASDDPVEIDLEWTMDVEHA